MRHVAAGLMCGLCALRGASAQPEGESPDLTEMFPHVRADVEARIVEFDGIVPIDCHDPETPHVFLEVVACAQNSKEHESLVMTRAKPSHIHAALLAIGLEPGDPGSWEWRDDHMTVEAPTGSEVMVQIDYVNEEGAMIVADARDWIVSVDGERFGREEDAGWVFAGSQIVTRGPEGDEPQVYDADGTGLIIGLTTFGSEVVAWRKVISHSAAVQKPEWIANRELVPAYKTPVVVRITPVEPPASPPEPTEEDRQAPPP